MTIALASFRDKLLLLEWSIRNSRTLQIVSYDYLYFQPQSYLRQYVERLHAERQEPLRALLGVLLTRCEALRAAVLYEARPATAAFFTYDAAAINLRYQELSRLAEPYSFRERIDNAADFMNKSMVELNNRGVEVTETIVRVPRHPFGFRRVLLTDRLYFEQVFPRHGWGLLQPITVGGGDDEHAAQMRDDLRALVTPNSSLDTDPAGGA